jgi:2-C-methyl-D-erythritol 4-phosphate cytidylyltransferase
MATYVPKQYLVLAGLPVITHSLNTLLQHSRLKGLVVVLNSQDTWWNETSVITDKVLLSAIGGKERCHSVLNGLMALQGIVQKNDWILVHDAARPCLHSSDLDALIDELQEDPVGGLLAIPVRDTIKRADRDGRVAATVDRNHLWHALTPQMFRFEKLFSALKQAIDCHLSVTDEASAIEAAGLAPRLIEGRADNIKITYPEDLALAEFHLTHPSK